MFKQKRSYATWLLCAIVILLCQVVTFKKNNNYSGNSNYNGLSTYTTGNIMELNILTHRAHYKN